MQWEKYKNIKPFKQKAVKLQGYIFCHLIILIDAFRNIGYIVGVSRE
jgi:hypothetical protein